MQNLVVTEMRLFCVVGTMSKCFLKPDGGNGFCISFGLSSFTLPRANSSRLKPHCGDNGGSEPLVLNVPNVQQDALVKLIEHCERAHRAQNAITDSQTAIEEAEGADQAMVDGLEFELLLRLTGAAHRLGLEPILTIAARRVAGLLLEACATPPGERAGLPMDAYLRPDPSDALSIEDKEAAPLEFVFTRPEWSHEGEYLIAAPPPAIASRRRRRQSQRRRTAATRARACLGATSLAASAYLMAH